MTYREMFLKTHLPKKKSKQRKHPPVQKKKNGNQDVSLRAVEAESVTSLLGATFITAHQSASTHSLRTFLRCVEEKLPAPGGDMRSKSIWRMDIFKTCHMW